MKNIHVLLTDKPSRLVKIKDNLFYTTTKNIPGGVYQNIYITSDEEIKIGDWYIIEFNSTKITKCTSEQELISIEGRNDCQKIILTTDQDLIKDGVQAIDDEFLEWFVKNPSCEEVKVVKEKQHIGEEVGESYPKGCFDYKIIGAKWKAKRMYSKEEVETIAKDAYLMGRNGLLIGVFNRWLKQFKKK